MSVNVNRGMARKGTPPYAKNYTQFGVRGSGFGVRGSGFGVRGSGFGNERSRRITPSLRERERGLGV